MKAIYLSASLLFFSASAIAQTYPLKPFVLPMFENNLLIGIDKNPTELSSNIMANGIITLRLDNMPCLVPDLTLVVAIPTSKTVQPNHYIPNPFFKYNTQALTQNKLEISK